MISRRAPLRTSCLLLAVGLWAAALSWAQEGAATGAGALVGALPDEELPLPALEPDVPYRPLNWYSREELQGFPPGSVPPVSPWCSGAYVAPPLPLLESDEPGAGSRVYVAADRMQLDENGESRIVGGVVVRQGQNLMRADNAVITGRRDRVLLEGSVYLQDPAMTLEARRAELTLDGSGSHIVNAQYAIHAARIRGQADAIHRSGQWEVTIDGGMYTTCEPGDDTWMLSAARIDLDREDGWGSARHMWLRIQSLPVLYVPYVRFPIDRRRQTGVLFPTFTVSGENGTDVAVPYYVNLDPQADLVLRPRWIEERGNALEANLRYLHGSPSYSVGDGEIGGGWLGKDNRYGGRDRWMARFRHEGKPSEELRWLADATSVSDDDYLDDLGTQLSVNRQSNLDRVLQATWTTPRWTALARAQGFQTINPLVATEDRPFRRLPQVALEGSLPDGGVDGLTWRGLAEVTQFASGEEVVGLQEAARLRLRTRVARDFGGEAARFIPALSLNHVSYELDGATGSRPSVTVPSFSLDTALLLERDFGFRDRSWLQTLEPRMFGLWAPYRDQLDLPVFDTKTLTSAYGQIFREDRFIGGDRFGDARQLTLALESRVYDAAGREAVRAGIGQTLHFADRRVRLAETDPVDTAESSPLALELGWRLSSRWSSQADGQWETDTGEFLRGGVRATWLDEGTRGMSLSWRYESPGIDQVELSGFLPVYDRWLVIGRSYYDIDRDRSLETLGGIEYESCCWRARLFARRTLRLDGVDLEPEDGVIFEVELKGLGSLGDRISTELANDIPGYETRLRAVR